jgi:NAD kinase
MVAANRRKAVLVTRHTRLAELVARYHTLAQARFYLEHLGADVSDYIREHDAYAASLKSVTTMLQSWGRYQLIDRTHLPNFVFGADDIVITLGQDGLVANTLKYLDGQPLIGVNPEPARWDGVLLPFQAGHLASVLSAVAADRRPTASVTMAEARLSNGQTLRAVNDLFVGPKTHTSALYEIAWRNQHEAQSSSGLIVATGMGSTAWLKSVVTGSIGIARARGGMPPLGDTAMPWDSDRLVFAVREPFPSKTSQAALVYGEITAGESLTLRSRMPENGVIFSDGIEADFLQFTAGLEARIAVCGTRGVLVQ